MYKACGLTSASYLLREPRDLTASGTATNRSARLKALEVMSTKPKLVGCHGVAAWHHNMHVNRRNAPTRGHAHVSQKLWPVRGNVVNPTVVCFGAGKPRFHL